MTDRIGTMVYWFVDGRPSGMGYFQKHAIPLPGDQVTMFPSEEDEYLVEILYRRFEQPERTLPRINIYAKTIDDTP